MKAFNYFMTQISNPETEQEAGHFEDLTTVVLVGFLSLIAILVLI